MSCAIIQMHVLQRSSDGLYGFVRRGDSIQLESKQNLLQILQGHFADYFALTMPEQGTTPNRVLDRKGVVELSSNSGQFWMRPTSSWTTIPITSAPTATADLRSRTRRPGDYDLVCWMPGLAEEADDELDADTRLVVRWTFRPPLQIVKRIRHQIRQSDDGRLHRIAGTIQTVRPLKRRRLRIGSAFGERAVRFVAASAAGVHFQLSVKVGGVVDNQAFRHQWQLRRSPFGQAQMRQDDVFQHQHQFRVNICRFPHSIAHHITAEKQMPRHSTRYCDGRRYCFVAEFHYTADVV